MLNTLSSIQGVKWLWSLSGGEPLNQNIAGDPNLKVWENEKLKTMRYPPP